MAGRDITEGRAARSIAVDLGIGTGNIWENTDIQYDVAIAGIPFVTAINDAHPYERATAPFRKQQFDNQRDPGEQSLSSWWIRSQSSFHGGEGIEYYDPLANPYSTTLATNSYRIKQAYGVNIWEPGQVTLLHEVTQGHNIASTIVSSTATAVNARNRSRQAMFSAQWASGSDIKNGFILHDGYDLDRIDSAGTVEHWVDYASSSYDPVYAATTDGTYMYWITNDTASGKLEMDKKLISAATSTAPTTMFTKTGTTVTNAAIAYVKQRLVVAANNSIYEVPTNATTSTSFTSIYTHPTTSYTFTSITESGTAVYVAGYEGIKSSIFKFTLDTATGAMPVLTSAITAAELPIGELVHKIFVYLGYMMIGTNKGVRVASIGADGSLTYGPLLFETPNSVYDFAARDRFVWCATGVTTIATEPGVVRIDLSVEIDTLRFAYANDLHYDAPAAVTTACAFIGNTNQLAFCTAASSEIAISNKARTTTTATLTTSTVHGLAIGDAIYVDAVDAALNGGYTVTGVPTTTTFTYTTTSSGTIASAAVSPTGTVVKVGYTYIESPTTLVTDGYVQTGYIRYNTLEPKNFKRLMAHGIFTYGSMSLQSVDLGGTVYDINSYDSVIGHPESTITQPIGAQDAIALRFHLYRDATTTTAGPQFEGYQLKAVPATPRNRIISIPLLCYDIDTDKYNATVGYEGYGFDKLAALETAEASGDVVTFQDFRIGETQQCLIEEVKFTNLTPPDKRLTNFGGILTLTIRTV